MIHICIKLHNIHMNFNFFFMQESIPQTIFDLEYLHFNIETISVQLYNLLGSTRCAGTS